MYVRVSAAGSLQKSGVVVDVKKESGILRVDHGVTINLMQHEVRVRIYNIGTDRRENKTKHALDHHIIGERRSVHRPHVHGTRPGPVPTKPAGTTADASTDNVHRFARKSPDTLLRLASDRYSFIFYKNIEKRQL